MAFYKIPIEKSINMTIPFITLTHAFGRIGCFCGGCCYGTPTTSIFGIKFPDGSPAVLKYGHDAYIHPVQLYESISLFLITIIILRVKEEYRFALYAMFYGILRFVIEYVRGDFRGQIFEIKIISPSQFLCISIVLIGYLMLLHKLKKANNPI